jgi:SPP1 gp7 family putative phage head morphogenesis protein
LAGGEVTKLANHQMLALVRTSVNQVANAASQASYKANQDVTKRYQYTATLDNRTSAICRALDGREFEYGKGPTPPQHFNCRSTTVPIIDYEGLGVEPPPRSDVIDDRQTYGEWLAKQTEARKAEILGSKGRAKIFDGFAEKIGPKEAIRRFVREDGSELSLIDLERKLKRTKGPTAAKPKPKPKPAAKPQPKASPVEYIREHQHDNGKNKLSHKAIADSLELAGNEKGLAGENMRKMLQFQQKKEIQTIWSTGREKLFGPDFDHWGDTEIIKALRAGNGKGEGVARAIADDLEKGRKNPLLSKIGKVSSGAAGHTMEGANFIVLKQEGQFKQITAKSISRIKNAAANSVLDAKAGRPQKVVTAQLYKKTGKTTWKTEDGWLGTYVHEMGHQVHFKAGKPSLGRIIEEGLEDLSGEKLLVERAKRRWKPSVYGGTNEMEQFAETFVQFVFAPDELRKANPYAYRWVAEAMEAALK